MTTIHLIGDGHLLSFVGLNHACVHAPGAVRLQEVLQGWLNNVTSTCFHPGDYTLFSFGEIDIRGDWDPLLPVSHYQPILQQYLEALQNFCQMYQLRPLVYNIMAPTGWDGNRGFPVKYDLTARGQLTKTLNTGLEDLCHARGIGFLKTNDFYTYKSGILCSTVVDGVLLKGEYNLHLLEGLARLTTENYKSDEKEYKNAVKEEAVTKLQKMLAEEELPRIHVIGDSHTLAFNDLIEPDHALSRTIIHHQGGITMHRISRDGYELAGREVIHPGYLRSKPGEWLICVHGEIDIRCHVGKQKVEKGRSLEEIIETMAIDYVKQAKAYADKYELKLIIYNVVPPTTWDGNIYYPVLGSLEERVESALLLNQTLQKLCEKEKIPFLYIWDGYATPEGTLRKELSDGGVHIDKKHNRYIAQKLADIVKDC